MPPFGSEKQNRLHLVAFYACLSHRLQPPLGIIFSQEEFKFIDQSFTVHFRSFQIEPKPLCTGLQGLSQTEMSRLLCRWRKNPRNQENLSEVQFRSLENAQMIKMSSIQRDKYASVIVVQNHFEVRSTIRTSFCRFNACSFNFRSKNNLHLLLQRVQNSSTHSTKR